MVLCNHYQRQLSKILIIVNSKNKLNILMTTDQLMIINQIPNNNNNNKHFEKSN